MATSPSRTEARAAALRAVADQPGIQQRDLAPLLEEWTGLANSTVLKLLRELEREGALEGRLDGRRKAYALPEGAAEPVADEPQSAHTTSGRHRELVALLAAVFIGAALAVFFLVPDRETLNEGSSRAAAPLPPPPAEPVGDEDPEPPAPEPAPAKDPKPKPKPAAREQGPPVRKVSVAVLSGSPVPGIAARTGDVLKRKGFRVRAVTNAPGPSATSAVLYTKDRRYAARAMARALGIKKLKPADPASRALSSNSRVIVIVGADRR